MDDAICDAMVRSGRCEDQPEMVEQFCKKACRDHFNKVSYFSSHEIYDDDGKYFELSARSWTGKKMNFEATEGYTSAAMTIGTTCDGEDSEEIISKIDKMRRELPNLLELYIFPFAIGGAKDRHIDQQACEEVFAPVLSEVQSFKRKNIHLMELSHINGPHTHPIFQYLKRSASIDTLKEDTETYFFVNPSGSSVHVLQGPKWDNIVTHVKEHLRQWEL